MNIHALSLLATKGTLKRQWPSYLILFIGIGVTVFSVFHFWVMAKSKDRLKFDTSVIRLQERVIDRL